MALSDEERFHRAYWRAEASDGRFAALDPAIRERLIDNTTKGDDTMANATIVAERRWEKTGQHAAGWMRFVVPLLVIALIGNTILLWGNRDGDDSPRERWAAQPVTPQGSPSVVSDKYDWWDAWPSCPVSAVQRTSLAEIAPGMPDFLPWIGSMPMNDDQPVVLAAMFSGDRPLPVGGSYGDGSNAKWLWYVNPPMSTLEVTARHGDGTTVQIIGPEDSSVAGGQWPSIVDLPKAGCWTFDIHAENGGGYTVDTQLTYVAVEGSDENESARSSTSSCPVTFNPEAIDDPEFGWGTYESAWGEGDLRVALPHGGVFSATDELTNSDGSMWDKFAVWGVGDTQMLSIRGERIDAEARPMTAEVPSGSGTIGVMLTFPTTGCWRVTVAEGDEQVTFTMLVVREVVAPVDGTPVPRPRPRD